MNKTYHTVELSQPWKDAFAEPEIPGVWFVWGASGNGKTDILWQLAKELTRSGRVVYNALEEGFSLSVKEAAVRANLNTCERRRIKVINEPFAELIERVRKPKSPRFIIIDSIQYLQASFSEYLELKRAAANKVLIFSSQAEGKSPAGRMAQKVMFDASLKIWVDGFKAFSKGRYIGPNGGIYTIWPEGAKLHWNQHKPITEPQQS